MGRREVLLVLACLLLLVYLILSTYSYLTVSSSLDLFLLKLTGISLHSASYRVYMEPLAAIAGIELWIPGVHLCLYNNSSDTVTFHITNVEIRRDGGSVASSRSPMGSHVTTLHLRPQSVECIDLPLYTWNTRYFVDPDRKVLKPGTYVVVVESVVKRDLNGGYVTLRVRLSSVITIT